MFLENRRDKEIMKIYQMLTGSDLEGNYNDGWTVSLLYALRCVDFVFAGSNLVNKKEYVVLAKELIRITQTEDNEGKNLYLSMPVWTMGLLEYMKNTGKRIKEIHSMNSYELMKDVSKEIEIEVKEV